MRRWDSGLPGSLRLRWRRLPALLAPLPLLALLFSLPPPGLERARGSLEGVVLADRQGRVLDRLPGAGGAFQHRLSHDELPPAVREITVLLEDRRFRLHPGIDPAALLRAAALNLARGRVVSGASTISMQTARLLAPHRGGLGGKLREMGGALALELRLGKEGILLEYLNRLPFGYNVRGFAAASIAYFDQPLAGLTRAQVLLLATIPRAPSLYDPFRHPERLARQAGLLAPRAGVEAEEIGPALATFRRGRPAPLSPRFTRWLRGELEREAEAHGGEVAGVPAGQIARVVTSLDGELERLLADRLEEVLRRGVPSGPGARPRPPGPRDAAGLVIDNRSGAILAWAGAGGSEIDGVLARRPAGSTLKPLLYALALERGWTAASLLPDTELGFGAGESYRPQNFDRRHRGPVRLRTALASSLNVPAVALLSRLGLEGFLALCAASGIELPPDAAARWGLGAAIGNVEATLLELVGGFSAFPRGGTLLPLRPVREVVTLDGRHLAPPPAAARRLFAGSTAWIIRDILSDPAARASGFGTGSRLNTPFSAMFKSGTASGYASLWCLGATEELTVGVWAGNLDGRPAFGDTGSSLPARVAVEVLARRARPGGAPPSPPPGVAEARICALSGGLAVPACPSSRSELFRAGTEPRDPCPLHTGRRKAGSIAAQAAAAGAGVRILSPADGAVFHRDPTVPREEQRIEVRAAAAGGEPLELSAPGGAVRAAGPLATWTFPLPARPGTYRLEVRGPAGSDAVSFSVK